MADQQKRVQQETAYMVQLQLMIICIPVPAYIIFSCFYDPIWAKNNVGMEIPYYDHSLQLHHMAVSCCTRFC